MYDADKVAYQMAMNMPRSEEEALEKYIARKLRQARRDLYNELVDTGVLDYLSSEGRQALIDMI